MSGLTLPNAFKLKGSENFNTWLGMVERLAFGAGLIQYITDKFKHKTPKEVDIYDDTILFEERRAWVKWKTGDSRMANCITFNCQPGPQLIIKAKSTALEKWKALKQAYEGTGIVIQQQELMKFVTIKIRGL